MSNVLLTAKEAQRKHFPGTNIQSIYKWIREGRIPVVCLLL